MAEAIRHDKTVRQLRLLSDALESGRLGPVRRLVNSLSAAEIGNLLESLPPAKRSVVWGLVDPADDGEVLVRGYTVMQGYLDDPAATAEAIDGAPVETRIVVGADARRIVFGTLRSTASPRRKAFPPGACSRRERPL